ncbi:hypothetical protein AB0N14_33810 [Streptomyces sp. NPDC051104]|uniref:hypothetical protein n=1 Tax=Streptomyces sp. NPDC051104 TaxID=3155044 RepID=UPI0034336BE8
MTEKNQPGLGRRSFVAGAAAVAGAALSGTATAAPGSRPAARGTSGAADTAIAFIHVTVIDGSGGSAAPDMTVVVEAGRITGLAPSARTRPRPGVRTVDLTGKYLIRD